MPEPTEPIQDTDPGHSVSTLLNEVHTAAERVEQGLSDNAPLPLPDPPPEDALTDIGRLDDDLARLTDTLISREQVSPGAGVPAPGAPAEMAIATFPRSTGLAQGGAPATAVTPSPRDPPGTVA